jgi:hypothetical protein
MSEVAHAGICVSRDAYEDWEAAQPRPLEAIVKGFLE